MDGDADTNVRPAGSASIAETAVAASLGPLFVTVSVNVTLVPSAGVALLTDFVIDTSASGALTAADAELFPGTGSYVADEAVAVFVSNVWVVTVATIVRVPLAPFVRSPTVHAPVPAL